MIGAATNRAEAIITAAVHYIEIEVRGFRNNTCTYRYYGHDVWEIKIPDGWRPIQPIYVPGEALRIAADHCGQP